MKRVCPHFFVTTSPSFLTHTVQMKPEEEVEKHFIMINFLTHTVQMKLKAISEFAVAMPRSS